MSPTPDPQPNHAPNDETLEAESAAPVTEEGVAPPDSVVPLTLLAVAAMSPMAGGQLGAAAGAAAIVILASHEDEPVDSDPEATLEADQESADAIPKA